MDNNWYQRFVIDGKPTTKVGFMNDRYYNKIEPLLPTNLSEKHVIDLCCNAGFVSFKLAEKGAHVIGVECDLKFYNQALYIRSIPGLFNTSPVPTFINKDVEDFNFEDYSPDLVLALSCIYHLSNPSLMVSRLSSLNAVIIASFRQNNLDKYLDLFSKQGLVPTKVNTYGRKTAVRFN